MSDGQQSEPEARQDDKVVPIGPVLADRPAGEGNATSTGTTSASADALEERKLVLAAQAGDRNAFAGLVHRHQRRAYAVARSIVLSHDDAEDVVQEVLLALHLKRNTWVRGTPVAPWLAAIARNKIVDAHRRRGRRPEVSIDSIVETLRDEGDVSEDQSQALERGIAGLPERQRKVLHAVSLEGYSAQEAAAQLQMSEVGVRVTLHRALKSLAVFFSQGNS